MKTSKRMIYYYFGSKEGLHIAVLEEAYRRIRAIESDLRFKGDFDTPGHKKNARDNIAELVARIVLC